MGESLKKALSDIEKEFGKGTIITFSNEIDNSIKRIPSGSIGLDAALGGGWPQGRIIEVFGPESSGKTTLTLHAIAEAHKLGKKVAFIDAEHAFDPVYAEGVGIDVYDEEKFLFSQPSSGEEALSVAEKLIKSGEIELIVIDSVAALTPKSELEGDFGDSKMGLQARMMSQAMRKLVGVISNTKCTVFFINQLRDNIGVMYGPSEVTTGGNALKFYASVRCEVRRVSQEKDKEGMVVSNRTRVKVVKNKTYPPFRQTEFSIEFGVGIDKYKEILLLATDMEIVKKAGAWYSYKDTKLGNGVDNVVVMMKDNPDLVEEMEKEVKMNLGLE